MNPYELQYIPMSENEMLQYNPDAKLYTYPDLCLYKSIDEIFGHLDKIILLYLIKSFNNGHWVGLIRRGNEIDFFDSYGYNIDEQEKFITNENVKYETGQNYKYLLFLLKNSGYKINYSKYKLQGKHTLTCGRFVSLRLLNKNLNNREFVYRFFNNYKNNNNDLIVCELIQ